MNATELKLFTGNSNLALAESIAKDLGTKLGECSVEKFSDGEVNLKINESIRGKDVFIIQSTSAPVNDNLMELLVFIDAVKRASPERITAVVPYYGYARQDRKLGARDPISAKLVADLLSVAGIQRMLSIDLHSGQIQGFFNVPVDNLTAAFALAEHCKEKKMKELVAVSPDVGGVRRARNFATYLDAELAIIDKQRPKQNVAEVMNVIGEVEGKNCVLVDDMIDTAGSICLAAEALKKKGAKSVYACASHGVLSGKAFEKIDSSAIEKVVVTDTIPITTKSKKIEVVSVAPLLSKAIQNIHEGKSVSELFKTEKDKGIVI